MKITFLCGCETGNIIARENLKTMTNIVTDDEGMLVCINHKVRRKGWRATPGGNNNWGKFSSWSPAEIEGFILFGEIPINHTLIVRFDDMPDIRDNCNPEDISVTLDLDNLRRYENLNHSMVSARAMLKGDGRLLLERNRIS